MLTSIRNFKSLCNLYHLILSRRFEILDVAILDQSTISYLKRIDYKYTDDALFSLIRHIRIIGTASFKKNSQLLMTEKDYNICKTVLDDLVNVSILIFEGLQKNKENLAPLKNNLRNKKQRKEFNEKWGKVNELIMLFQAKLEIVDKGMEEFNDLVKIVRRTSSKYLLDRTLIYTVTTIK